GAQPRRSVGCTRVWSRMASGRHPSFGTLANGLLCAASMVGRSRRRWLARKKHGWGSLASRGGSHSITRCGKTSSGGGVRFRHVKSGDFYKRAFVLAKRMGVPLRKVAVVPFGRGHLTNAYSRSNEIAITDDYGHWLSGSRLEFVVGHELRRKKLLITIGVFVAVSLPAFALPYVQGS